MYTNNPYAQGGWHNPQNAHSINGSPWCPNALHPPTFGALPPVQTNSSILTFEFSAFQPDILNSVVTGPNNCEYFTIRSPTPTCTVIYKAGSPFCTINWQTHPIVEAGSILSRQRTGEFLKLAADNSHRFMTVNDTGKVYAWIPRGNDVILYNAGPNPPVQFARIWISRDNRKVMLEITNESFRAGLFERCIISAVLLFSARNIN